MDSRLTFSSYVKYAIVKALKAMHIFFQNFVEIQVPVP